MHLKKKELYHNFNYLLARLKPSLSWIGSVVQTDFVISNIGINIEVSRNFMISGYSDLVIKLFFKNFNQTFDESDLVWIMRNLNRILIANYIDDFIEYCKSGSQMANELAPLYKWKLFSSDRVLKHIKLSNDTLNLFWEE